MKQSGVRRVLKPWVPIVAEMPGILRALAIVLRVLCGFK